MGALGDPGVTIDPASILIGDLRPGQVESRQIVVSNQSENTVVVRLDHVESGPLFDTAPPLEVQYAAAPLHMSACGDESLPVVRPDEQVTVTLTASMPIEMGNEAQGQAGESVLTFIATDLASCPGQAEPGGRPPLAATGTDLLWLLLAAAALMAGGLVAWRSHTRQVPR